MGHLKSLGRKNGLLYRFHPNPALIACRKARSAAMVRMTTPICDFGWRAPGFSLPDPEGRIWTLEDCRGERGTLVMFICNHCPYVKAVIDRIIGDARRLEDHGVKSVAIMPNDVEAYPEDGPEHMRRLAADLDFPFPYLFDESQATARAYGAVCTPDFFGFNAALQLQYRGRLDESGRDPAPPTARRELLEAMQKVAATGHGPAEQTASVGCSIKWRE
jgi:peroxiredoxin